MRKVLSFYCSGLWSLSLKSLRLNQAKVKRNYLKLRQSSQQRVFSTSGQVTFNSHPHLLKQNEVLPGISFDEIKQRKKAIFEYLPKHSLVIIFGNKMKFACGSVFYPFQQNPNLLYLSGFDEPNCALVMDNFQGSNDGEEDGVLTSSFFCEPELCSNVIFHGTNVGPINAKIYFDFDKTYEFSSLCNYLKTLLSANPSLNVFAEFSKDFSCMSHDIEVLFSGSKSSPQLKRILEHVRAFKSPSEVALIKKAGFCASQGFIQAMKLTKENLLESQIGSIIEHTCKMNGALGLSYSPVVANGKNSLVLHYVKNQHVLKKNDLVLVDAGANYSHYRSDVSRTWPVSKRFSPEQKSIYEIVLVAHENSIKMCRPELNKSLNEIYLEAANIIYYGLRCLGFKISIADVQSKYFPHDIGHHLGLDLHDCPSRSSLQALKPGNVITIEPGIYIPTNDENCPEKYRGIGIRIEDNVVIGNEGIENLTSSIPTHPEEIEQLMNSP